MRERERERERGREREREREGERERETGPENLLHGSAERQKLPEDVCAKMDPQGVRETRFACNFKVGRA